METKKINRNVTIAIVGTIILLVGVIGLTFAYFMSRASSNNFSVSSGGASINFDGGNTVTASKMIPIEEDDITTQAVKKTFSMSKPSGSEDLYAKINLEVTSISTGLKDYDFKWALYEGTTKVTTGTFASLDDTNIINLANNVLIDSTTDKNYILYLWIQETNQEQSIDLMNGTFKGKVVVSSSKSMSNTLASKILAESPKSNPNFTENSTDKGLYVQKDDSTKSNYGFPTYYYRGAVENNYVSFAGFTWRIVRINEDGSIKLVTQNAISNISYDISNECKSNYLNCSHDYIGSNLETTIKNWYIDNISNTNSIAIGNYCGNENTTILDNNPTFICPNEDIIINEKYGTIRADEVVYSGALVDFYYDNNDNLTYLENGTDWWTMSPDISYNSDDEFVFAWYSYDSEYYLSSGANISYNDSPKDVRVIINLKPDVIVASGNGTESSPYIIQ